MAAIGLGLVVMGVVGSGLVLAKESSGPAPMTAAQTNAVMAAVVDAWETDGALTPYLAENASLTLVDEERTVDGPTAVAAALANLDHGAFAAQTTVTHLLVGDGHATLEAELDGTQISSFDGVPATGRVVRASYAAGFDLAGGRITAVRLYFPTAAVLRQLSGKPRWQ
jgi:ketosteroid isomerase-like protein